MPANRHGLIEKKASCCELAGPWDLKQAVVATCVRGLPGPWEGGPAGVYRSM